MTRPIPVPDDLSDEYWRAAAQHVLAVPRCSACGLLAMPPDVMCPHCGATPPQLRFEPLSGRGTVRSWTVMRQSFLPGFADDVPFVLVDVELAEQSELRLIGRLLDGTAALAPPGGAPDASLRIGAPVQVAFEDLAPGVSVPAFALVEAR